MLTVTRAVGLGPELTATRTPVWQGRTKAYPHVPRALGPRSGYNAFINATLAPARSTIATRGPDERRKAGTDIRSEVARSAHSEWAPHSDRADPVGILIEQGKSRIQELLPI